MLPIVLDTDVVSLIVKRRLPLRLSARLVATEPFISFVTLGELTKWSEARNWGARHHEVLANWLSEVGFFPGDEDVAVTWGKLSAAAMRRGRPRPQNDMWIAACCLTYELPLATLNVKDFEDFAEYHGLQLITN